ncbi:hypothetical protein [Rhizobium sp. BK251]|uniref:hypothetical protein n=1 Tax=Rhizobium sp. BK251 TaxID=2512125 RepID=UPI00105179D4|nr:hypothetical protein [Rhizobium sp. BK251]TCL74894.1 hypothetical protein EV286_102458 [Rhizobium sp. BK251]
MDAAMGANCWVDIFNSSYGRTNLRSQPITHANSEGQHSAWRKAASPRRREPLCVDAATRSLLPMISAEESDGLIIPPGRVSSEKRIADGEFESWNTIALATFLFEGECHGNIPNPVDGLRPLYSDTRRPRSHTSCFDDCCTGRALLAKAIDEAKGTAADCPDH